MTFTFWAIAIGIVFILMALGTTTLKRLPLTTSIIYLGVGFGLAISGTDLLKIDLMANSGILMHITEIALIISLFTTGLKLRNPLKAGRWKIPVRLAFGSMVITVLLITLVGVFWLHLPLGVAILLGAILAPTDPVLASDVQLENPADRDRLRFGLTGEAGLNDSTGSPFLLLGLGLLGLHELGDFGWEWLLVDVLWAILAGPVVGALLGNLVGRLVVYLRLSYKEAIGLDDFLALGLMALSYGVAMLVHTNGFLAVFAAGLALRQVEAKNSGEHSAEAREVIEAIAKVGQDEEVATHPEKAPAYMAQAVLGFNEQLERIGEVIVVIIIGGLLATVHPPLEALWFVPLLFLVIRPIAVEISLVGSKAIPLQRRLFSWFGIRGIGSLFYVLYAIEHGLPADVAPQLTALVLTVVAASIIVHGISVTPLMQFYSKRRKSHRPDPESQSSSLGEVS